MGAPDPVIFVVDDDKSVRESLRRLLTSVGMSVEVFPTAQAFLGRPRLDTPGCVVLDVRLPGLSGLDLQRELAGTDAPLPIVFITGHGDIPMSVRAMKAGAVEFLTKPFREQELLEAIRWAVAVISVAVAAALTTGPGGERLFPEPPERFVHGVTLLYAAGVLSAWLGGMGPGALAALLGALVVDWFITPPLYAITLDFDFLLRIAVFTLSALLVGWLSSRRRRPEDALRHSRDQLELRVQARSAERSDSNARLHAY